MTIRFSPQQSTPSYGNTTLASTPTPSSGRPSPGPSPWCGQGGLGNGTTIKGTTKTK